jgi:hypothetical protein
MAGAAEARLAATPLKLEPADRQDWERIQAEVRVQLDEGTFAAA